jgi:hypothetical protein
MACEDGETVVLNLTELKESAHNVSSLMSPTSRTFRTSERV